MESAGNEQPVKKRRRRTAYVLRLQEKERAQVRERVWALVKGAVVIGASRAASMHCLASPWGRSGFSRSRRRAPARGITTPAGNLAFVVDVHATWARGILRPTLTFFPNHGAVATGASFS